MSNSSLRAALKQAPVPDPSATAPPSVAFKLDLDEVDPPSLADLASLHSLQVHNSPKEPAEIELPEPEAVSSSIPWKMIGVLLVLAVAFVAIASGIVLVALGAIVLL